MSTTGGFANMWIDPNWSVTIEKKISPLNWGIERYLSSVQTWSGNNHYHMASFSKDWILLIPA